MNLAVGLARGVHLAALLSLFGTLVVAGLVVPATQRVATAETVSLLRDQMYRLLRVSAIATLISGLLWLAVQAADMAGAGSIGATLAATPTALFGTQFGRTLLLRLLLVIVVSLLAGHLGSRRRIALAILVCGGAVVAQSWMGHPAATGDPVLLGASMLHLLAAGAWLGALVPLFLLVRAMPGAGAARAAERFSWIGQLAVLTLAATAMVQGWLLIGNEAGLIGTGYGRLAVFKLVAFGVLLLCAAINRFKLTPILAGTDAARAQRHLLASIGIEVGLGLLVVLAAGWLATLTPGAHDAPLWPFALRPNKALLSDTDVRNAFILAAILLLVALALAGRAALFRRWRWPVLAVMLGLGWYANKVIDEAPFLDPMFIKAYPTSYYQSPSGFAAIAIDHGAGLYAANCAPCHGAQGRGDGPAAAGLAVRPANLTQDHVWGHADGELFWWLTTGIEDPRHGMLMPPFEAVLSEDDRWAVIDFIHAQLAGTTMAENGHWSVPVAAPALAAVCQDGRDMDLRALRGKFVRLIAVGANAQPGADPGATAIPVIQLARPGSELAGCVAEGDAIWSAYALLAHVAPEQLAGTQFLVDPDGWLRWVFAPEQAAALAMPGALQRALDEIAAHPLAAGARAGHQHH